MIKIKYQSKRVLIIGLFFFLILLFLSFSLVLLKPQDTSNFYVLTKGYFLSLLEKTNVYDKSSANLSLSSSKQDLSSPNKLKISFDITKDDFEVLNQFSDNLEASADWAQGIELVLDQNTADRLSKLLPVQLKLDIEPKKIKFYNFTPNNLKNSLNWTEYSISTGSGNLVYKGIDEGSFILKVDDPKLILDYATASGQFNISSKIIQIYPILDKVSRMEIRINGKSINGEIILKGY